MKNKRMMGLFLVSLCCLTICGCQRRQTTSVVSGSPNPNASITYEKGRDQVGVLKSMDAERKTMTFYQPLLEKEATYSYTGATEVLTKNDKAISSESLEIGQVFDLYLKDDKSTLDKVQSSEDVLEYEEVKNIEINTDESFMKVNGVRYRYGSGFQVFSEGKPIDLQEISASDEVTFRGVKGKAYSLVVTKGHGYIKPVKYKDFVGGTMTISGIRILSVTEDMLVPVPEGTYEVSMKNGDFEGSRSIAVERDKTFELDMSLFKSMAKDKGQVVFDIDPQGAELYVNGTMTDYSKPVSLKYGKHSIRVVLDGYTTYAGVVDVQSANPTVRISLAEEEAEISKDDESSVEKESADSQSSVTDTYDNEHKITVSTPAGARVYLDGNYQGVAPCSFPKKIGAVTLTVSKDGYVTKSYSVTTTDDDEDVSWSFPDLVAEGNETN